MNDHVATVDQLPNMLQQARCSCGWAAAVPVASAAVAYAAGRKHQEAMTPAPAR